MFSHLDRLVSISPDGALSSQDINSFTFDGRALRLIVQTGIWKPVGLEAAISIRTTFTPSDQPPHYEDDVGADGLVRYKYRGTDPDHSDNRALRNAMANGRALAYFIGVDRGVYVPRYPVWVVDEDPCGRSLKLAIGDQRKSRSELSL